MVLMEATCFAGSRVAGRHGHPGWGRCCSHLALSRLAEVGAIAGPSRETGGWLLDRQMLGLDQASLHGTS